MKSRQIYRRLSTSKSIISRSLGTAALEPYTPQSFLDLKVRDLYNVLGNDNQAFRSVSQLHSIHHAVCQLVQYNISTLPVRSEANNAYVGFCGIKDVLRFMSSTAKEYCTYKSSKEYCYDKKNMREIINTIALHSIEKNVAQINNIVHPFPSVSENENMSIVVDLLKSGTPVVSVLNDNGLLVKVISKSDVIEKLVFYKYEEYNDDLNTKLNKLPKSNIFKNVVVAYGKGDTAFSCLSLMGDQNLSNLPILNENKDIISAIGGIDLRIVMGGIVDDNLIGAKNMDEVANLLTMPVEDFLKHVHSPEFRHKMMLQGLTLPLPLEYGTFRTVHPLSTLGDVLHLLNQCKLHRVYVVEHPLSSNIVGVMSMKDIFQILF